MMPYEFHNDTPSTLSLFLAYSPSTLSLLSVYSQSTRPAKTQYGGPIQVCLKRGRCLIWNLEGNLRFQQQITII